MFPDYKSCPKTICNHKKLRETNEGLICDSCRSSCSEVEAINVSKAVGILLANSDEVFALNIWHRELIQILNHVSQTDVSCDAVEQVVTEMKENFKFPIQLKCSWSSFNGARNMKKI